MAAEATCAAPNDFNDCACLANFLSLSLSLWRATQRRASVLTGERLSRSGRARVANDNKNNSDGNNNNNVAQFVFTSLPFFSRELQVCLLARSDTNKWPAAAGKQAAPMQGEMMLAEKGRARCWQQMSQHARPSESRFGAVVCRPPLATCRLPLAARSSKLVSPDKNAHARARGDSGGSQLVALRKTSGARAPFLLMIGAGARALCRRFANQRRASTAVQLTSGAKRLYSPNGLAVNCYQFAQRALAVLGLDAPIWGRFLRQEHAIALVSYDCNLFGQLLAASCTRATSCPWRQASERASERANCFARPNLLARLPARLADYCYSPRAVVQTRLPRAS